MSYSETSDLVEKRGYEGAFKHIYAQYQKKKAAFLKKKKESEDAEQEMNMWSAHADYFVMKAAQNKLTIEEEGSHVVRMVLGDEVVHFRRDSEERIFIGYWPLSNLNETPADL